MVDFNFSIEALGMIAVATLLTSAFTAVLGQGGGILLMGVLAQALPAPVLIPVHAVIQAASNSSRALLSMADINWKIITPILIGIIIGAVLVTPLITHINWEGMPFIIGLFILWTVWGKGLHLKKTIPFALTSLGVIQGSLGVLLGATGPLGSSILLAKGLNRNQLIASNAVIMFFSHGIKILVFIFAGITLHHFAGDLTILCLAAILGSFIGNHFKTALSEALFLKIFKITLTLLALRMMHLSYTNLFHT